jgi:hypothetical protein
MSINTIRVPTRRNSGLLMRLPPNATQPYLRSIAKMASGCACFAQHNTTRHDMVRLGRRSGAVREFSTLDP